MAYEYAQVSSYTNELDHLVGSLNDLATEGWELVTSHSADKTIGINNITVLIRRELEAPRHPVSAAPGWYPDPTGRWDARYWNGRAWTFGVLREGDGTPHRDPPTMLPPTKGLAQ